MAAAHPHSSANVSSGAANAVWGGDGCFGQVSASISWGASGGVSIKLTGSSPTKLSAFSVDLLMHTLASQQRLPAARLPKEQLWKVDLELAEEY